MFFVQLGIGVESAVPSDVGYGQSAQPLPPTGRENEGMKNKLMRTYCFTL